jgi:hypothetical protein
MGGRVLRQDEPQMTDELTSGLVQVCHAAAAAAAAQALAQSDRREVVAETLNVIGRIEDAPVLASSADGNERHLRIDQLAERAAIVLVRIAIAGAHMSSALSPATSGGTRGR